MIESNIENVEVLYEVFEGENVVVFGIGVEVSESSSKNNVYR